MLLLDAEVVAEVLDYASCAAAVEEAFRQHGRGGAGNAAVCAVHVDGGGFHVKIAALEVGRGSYLASKTNANFPVNPSRGLPTIQGVIGLFDARTGVPLALLDSGEVTVRRTAAATAVAAKHLARPDATTLAVCGCGVQGRAHVEALCGGLPIERVLVFDADPARAEGAALDLTDRLGLPVQAERDFRARARESDVCVTCTASRDFVLGPADVRPGTFVAGVGVDDPGKRELEPELLARSRVVVDVLEQCIAMGDLRHAVSAGAMTRKAVHAELGEVVAGLKSGRTSEDEVFVFDSTGTALEDAAAAAVVYERALALGRGFEVSLAGHPAAGPSVPSAAG